MESTRPPPNVVSRQHGNGTLKERRTEDEVQEGPMECSNPQIMQMDKRVRRSAP